MHRHILTSCDLELICIVVCAQPFAQEDAAVEVAASEAATRAAAEFRDTKKFGVSCSPAKIYPPSFLLSMSS